MQICPSILESSSSDFIYQLNKLSPYFNYFQIDVADGIFVSNKTIQIEEIIQAIKPSNYLAMKPLIFDFHLMVKDYDKEIEKLRNWKIKQIKINNIFIHYSLLPVFKILINKLFLDRFSLSIGLVLNPQDQVSDLVNNYDLNKISSIQIMSVIPGKQGSAFIPETLKKIEQLKIAGYRSKIFLDGGVNHQTLPLILNQKYKPDVIGVGSYFTQAKEKLSERVVNLKSLIKQSPTLRNI